ncbi:Coiled-coil domain-containing protein 12 [Nymphon striatum]|nr:Coiled-coil domain-containing protein 12 [Nymphon striatum]
MATPGTLEAEALKRKERLRALKKRSAPEDASICEETGKSNGALPKPKFRSYNPQDEQLKENTVPRITPGTVEEHVKEDIERSKKIEPIMEEVDLVNLAPRKPDWDLKRDVAKKLERLEKRTQRAIVEIIRDRIKAGEEDPGVAVSMAAKEIDSDDD